MANLRNFHRIELAATHLSLGKDTPVPRPVQAAGKILTKLIRGGPRHEYVPI